MLCAKKLKHVLERKKKEVGYLFTEYFLWQVKYTRPLPSSPIAEDLVIEGVFYTNLNGKLWANTLVLFLWKSLI